MGSGVDPVAYAILTTAAGLPVIASGGVASLDDIIALRDADEPIEGVVVGRALYEGAFTLPEAIAAASGSA
jgi:phosphoribosylformimino-5-aminoimidazole carboxamide ribotide isomerase